MLVPPLLAFSLRGLQRMNQCSIVPLWQQLSLRGLQRMNRMTENSLWQQLSHRGLQRMNRMLSTYSSAFVALAEFSFLSIGRTRSLKSSDYPPALAALIFASLSDLLPSKLLFLTFFRLFASLSDFLSARRTEVQAMILGKD